MFKIQRCLSTLIALAALAGCDEASDLEKKADQAQANADEKIADLRSASSQDIREVQAAADAKIAATQSEFNAMREDYRHETTLKLVVLDKRVADLDARVVKLSGVPRAELQAKLNLIKASRGVFLDDYKQLENVTGASWDATKTRLDREWADLNKLVDAA